MASDLGCLEMPVVVCNSIGENSTFTHTACADGGIYIYTLDWGDPPESVSTGVSLANNESVTYTHVYETEGKYEASYKVEVTFSGTTTNLSQESDFVWEIGNESCQFYTTEAPTASPAPSFASLPTSGGSPTSLHDVCFPLALAATTSVLFLFKKLCPFS